MLSRHLWCESPATCWFDPPMRLKRCEVKVTNSSLAIGGVILVTIAGLALRSSPIPSNATQPLPYPRTSPHQVPRIHGLLHPTYRPTRPGLAVHWTALEILEGLAALKTRATRRNVGRKRLPFHVDRSLRSLCLSCRRACRKHCLHHALVYVEASRSKHATHRLQACN